MKSIISTICLLLTTTSFLLIPACSGDEEEVQKDSSIDRAVKEVADRAVDYIQTPIEKAEAVKEIEEVRRRELEEQNP
ncbi:MAG: hypothetical protein P8X39_11760 [Desulfofustis sp.]|jgi:cytochrome c-type biogenesis protein CcmH/NrfG